MKVIFVHYFFIDDGVTRSVLNNIKGLKEISEDFKFAMVADSFSPSLPDYIEKKFIDWNSENLAEKLESLTKDADLLIIENPIVGIFPRATLAFREFAERNKDKNIVFRVHDLIDDRPHLFEKFREVFKDFDSAYPRTENVTFITLTNADKTRLNKKGLSNVRVLPNSVIVSDLTSDDRKSSELRNFLEEKRILDRDEKILLYPVRVEKRKNIEETLLITKLLNGRGENFKLIVTIPLNEDYGDLLNSLARRFSIPCSIGEAGKFIGYEKNKGFTIAEMFALSDLVITTSVREGFGFAYVEPWISGKPLIGRKISSVSTDFESNGINLEHLYDDSILPASENPDERIEKIAAILSDPEKMRELSEKLNLPRRIQKAKEVLKENSSMAIKNYGHMNVARQLLSYLRVPKCFN